MTNSLPSLRRGPATRAQKETFIVFLERGLPEAYLQWVKTALGHHQITERYPEVGEPPVDQVRRAVRAGRDARAKGSEFDHLWCWFEGMSQSGLHQLRASSTRRVGLAASDPGIELWLLLHFQEMPNDVDSAGISGALQTHLSDPERDVVEGALEGRFAVAAERARRLGTVGASTNLYDFVERVIASFTAFDPGGKHRI